MAEAKIGFGSTFGKGNGATPEVFSPLGEVTNLSHSGFSRDVEDATHMQSPNQFREFIPGLRDGGEVSVTMNLIPKGATSDTLEGEFATDAISNWQVEFPGGETFTFAGICTSFAWEDPHDVKMEATATFKITGMPVFAAAP